MQPAGAQLRDFCKGSSGEISGRRTGALGDGLLTPLEFGPGSAARCF